MRAGSTVISPLLPLEYNRVFLKVVIGLLHLLLYLAVPGKNIFLYSVPIGTTENTRILHCARFKSVWARNLSLLYLKRNKLNKYTLMKENHEPWTLFEIIMAQCQGSHNISHGGTMMVQVSRLELPFLIQNVQLFSKQIFLLFWK